MRRWPGGLLERLIDDLEDAELAVGGLGGRLEDDEAQDDFERDLTRGWDA